MKKKDIDAKELGIDLKGGKEEEWFKWFLACLLFGKPIQQKVAARTYHEFVRAGLTSPEAIIKAGWNKLVVVLDKGHYVKYDYSTATKLSEICKELLEKYGSVGDLLKETKDRNVLSQKLQEFKGVGPMTTRIFVKSLG